MGAATVAATKPSPLRAVPNVVLALAVSMLWGSNFVFMKKALRDTTPLLMASARAVFGGVVLTAIALAGGNHLPQRHQLRGIFLIALNMTAISTACMFLGAQRVPAGLASVLSNTMPLFMVVLTPLWFRDRPTRRQLVGFAIGSAGTVVIASKALDGDVNGWGIVFMLAASATGATGSIMYRRYPLADLHPLIVVGVQLLMSAVMLAPVGLLTESISDTTLRGRLVFPFVWLSTMGLGVAFVVWQELVKRGGYYAAATTYLVPVFGVAFGIALLDESLYAYQVAGGVIALAGVAVVQLPLDRLRARRRSG